MPNAIAYFALILWPVVTLALFASVRPGHALVWSILGGYLLLPVNTNFDFPGIPAFDKTSIPNISALIGALIFANRPVVRPPREWWVLALMVIYVVSPLFTVFTNGDSLQFGSFFIPGLEPYDAFSAAAYKGIDLIPFLLGYNLLKHSRAKNGLLSALVIAAIGYSVLMLIEIRLSPQLHTWIYGFFPHSFLQQIRDGGFRPVVFLGHGLLIAIFTSMATLAAAYLVQCREKLLGVSAWLWLVYLFSLLILCRSLGALLLTVSALSLIFLARPGVVRLICALVGLAVLAYPALRGAELIPVQTFTEQIATLDAERAGSFQFRVDNEDSLLARANLRPWFGWGGYGRNRVYDEFTGYDLSTTDGTWIIIVGTNGWTGYLATFGLLCLPMMAAWRNGGRLSRAGMALSLILAVNLLDLVPNSSLTPLTWLIAGSLIAVQKPSAKLQKSISHLT